MTAPGTHAEALVAKLEDENEDVRWATVKALEKLEAAAPGTHAAALVTKLEDQSWLVRRATMKVLGELEVPGSRPSSKPSWPQRAACP